MGSLLSGKNLLIAGALGVGGYLLYTKVLKPKMDVANNQYGDLPPIGEIQKFVKEGVPQIRDYAIQHHIPYNKQTYDDIMSMDINSLDEQVRQGVNRANDIKAAAMYARMNRRYY